MGCWDRSPPGRTSDLRRTGFYIASSGWLPQGRHPSVDGEGRCLNGKGIAGSDRPVESTCLEFNMLFSHEFAGADTRVPFETGRPIFLDVTKKTGL